MKSFTIIGAGKVGTTIALLLKDYLKFDYFISKTRNKKHEDLTNKKIDIKYPIIESDFIFITVPDDKIKKISKKLIIKGNPLIIHFSGALPASEIDLDYDKLSVHPMMSIVYPKKAATEFKNHFITIQGKDKAKKRFKEIIKYFTSNYISVNEQDKISFHLAAVLTNNFPTILISIATNLIKEKINTPKEALDVLLPLLNDSFVNLDYKKELSKTLTGPLVRKDQKTINNHLSIIKNDDLKKIYLSFKEYFNKND